MTTAPLYGALCSCVTYTDWLSWFWHENLTYP